MQVEALPGSQVGSTCNWQAKGLPGTRQPQCMAAAAYSRSHGERDVRGRASALSGKGLPLAFAMRARRWLMDAVLLRRKPHVVRDGALVARGTDC